MFDKKDFMDTHLAGFVDVEERRGGGFGWNIYLPPDRGLSGHQTALFRGWRGNHETQAEAVAAAVRYIRKTQPRLVREAAREAEEARRHQAQINLGSMMGDE